MKKVLYLGVWSCIMIIVALEESHQNFVTAFQILVHLA